MLLLALLSPFSPSFGPVLPESVVPGEDAGGGIVTWDNFLHLTFGNKLYIQYNTYLSLKMTTRFRITSLRLDILVALLH